MEMRSSALRPLSLFSCVIASSIVLLLVPSFLVPLWIHRMNSMSNEANSITDKSQQELLSRMKDIEKMLPTKREITNLQRYLSSSLNATDLPFSDIETKVAPKLFLAFSTIQHLVQISYIGSDGLFFSYCIKGDQPFAVYSNTTFSTHNYSWYTQPVTEDMGKLYGDPLRTSPIAVLNSSTFRKGHVTVGSGLSNDGDLLLLDTIGLDGITALSLGFSLKPLTDFFSTSINSYGGGIYLATNDGTSLLARGSLSTQMVQTDTSTLIHLSDDKISKTGDLSCQHNGGNMESSALEIKNQEYIFHCSSLEIVGVQFVCAIALPHDGLASLMKQNVKFAFAFPVIMVISIVTLIFLTIRAAVREMYLCAALIKHMEATQQAERKSINKSLSLARASHDVRNYISAIVNMVQHACGLVAAGSDLERELKQVETTTETLLNTLNSILDNSKIEAGKAQLEEAEFDLEQLLEEVVDLYYSVGMKKGVDVVLDPCDGTASKFRYVKGDVAKLKQILSNLLSNAVKFTAEGHVAVRVWARKPSFENEILATNRQRSVTWRSCLQFFKRDDEALKDLKVINYVQQDPNCVEFIFEVSDTGKGIPTEKHQMVFENYVQDKDKGDLKHEGTGLGLGIVQTLVRIMGGEIAIVEKEFGERGTCFRFNTFFMKCESEGSNDDVMEDVMLSSYRHNSTKVEGSHVVLFIPGEERSKISKKFMENLGVKVSVVKKYEDLSETLKRTRQKHTTSSMKFDLLGRSISSSSTSSLKEMPLSAFDGADDISSSSTTNFVLVVIDTSAATFRQISQVVAKFRREHSISHTRIVYIHRADKDLSLGRENLPLMDVIISQPFHGSRLFQVIRLLPEFGGKMPSTNVREGISYLDEKLKFKRGEKNNEIEEIGSSNKDNPKPLHELKVLVADDKPLHGKKVLLVEDNILLRKIATSMLLKIGADIEACENGEEALQMVVNKLRDGQTNPEMHPVPSYDYILMDCEMSVMDGYEATRRIREEEKKYGLHIPIIAVTGHTGSEEKKKITEAGMDIHLSKPLKVDQLLNAISSIDSKSLKVD